MTDILKPWIRTLVAEELARVVKEDAQQTTRRRNKADGPDGVESRTIRIILREREGSFKSPRTLQVVKFLGYEAPFKVVVADTESYVSAIFSDDGVRAFKASHQGQRVTNGTEGGLIQIKSCELVIRACRNHHIGLRIDDCRYLGLGLSPVLGRPLLVTSRHSIASMMDRLSKSDDVSMAESSQGKDKKTDDARTSSAQDQPDDLPGASQSNGLEQTDTQLPFSTQVTRDKEPKPSLSQTANSGNRTAKIGQLPGSSNLEGSAGLGRSREQLIALLGTKRLSTAAQGRAGPALPQAQTPSSPDPLHTEAKAKIDVVSTQLQSGGPMPAGSTHAKVAPLLNGNSAESPNQTQMGPPKAKPTQRDSSRRPGSRHERTTTNEPSPVPETPLQTRTTEHEKRNGSVMRDVPPSNTTPAQVRPEEVSAEGQSRNVNISAISDDPWKGMTHIRKRDVTIPKDQQTLLEREDCWIPPEPGARGPVANVPIVVLQELSKWAERPLRNSQAASEPGVQQPDADGRSGVGSDKSDHQKSNENSDYDSDELPWSSSPVYEEAVEELPPDSSALGPAEDKNRAPPSTHRSGRQGSPVLESERLHDGHRSKRKRTEEPDQTAVEERPATRMDSPADSDTSEIDSCLPVALGDKQISVTPLASQHTPPKSTSTGIVIEQSQRSTTDHQGTGRAAITGLASTPVNNADIPTNPNPSQVQPGRLDGDIRRTPTVTMEPQTDNSTRRTRPASDDPEEGKVRRKRVKVKASLAFAQEERQVQDPSTLLRQQKAAFLRNYSEAPSGGGTPSQPKRAVEEQTSTVVLRENSPAAASPNSHPDKQSTPSTRPEKDSIARLATGSPPDDNLSPRPVGFDPTSHQPPDPEPPFSPARTHDPPPTKEQTRRHSADTDPRIEASQALSPTSRNLYEEFRHAYPGYTGSLKTFVRSCALIEWLVEEERMEHRALWDEFVFRYANDYEEWCQESGVEMNTEIPYEAFFKEVVQDIVCLRHIVTPETLLAALQLDPTSAGEMRYVVLGGSRGTPVIRKSSGSPFSMVSRYGSDRRRSAGFAIRGVSHASPSIRL
ncbi:MAG: hypothetical protein M1823_000162 [Watsoniomyces obsoletus]|nr:MAG: hypothetical protein M1823_000162 [Watsoniomyces obsoletus]